MRACAFGHAASSPKCASLKFANCRVGRPGLIYAICDAILGIEAGVNITAGLPVVRTSVDHRTAFDIAGMGVADERSLLEALRQAVALAPKRL